MKTLQELFDSGVKFTKEESFGKRLYTWKIESILYTMIIVKRRNNETWNILFSSEDSKGLVTTGTTGQGNELKVFSTVIDIINKFVKKNDPQGFTFSAKGGTRSKLYDRMIKKFAKKYNVNTSINGNEKIYKLIKNENT